MKKYFFGLAAVVFAIAFSAFTKPESTSRVNYYSFEYLAPSSSYLEADVENEAVANWGYGTSVTSPTDFQAVCSPTTAEKACEIIVTEAETVSTGSGRRLRVTADGGSVITINAKTVNLHTNTFMVDAIASPTVDGVDNKNF